MREMHAQRKESGIIYIGVHTPSSDEMDILNVLEKDKLEYPICIDTPAADKAKSFGSMSGAYAIRGIPHAVVIDRNGNVAASSFLNEALHTALKLAGEAP